MIKTYSKTALNRSLIFVLLFFHSSGFSQSKKLGVFYYICINSYCIVNKGLSDPSFYWGFLLYNYISFAKIFSKVLKLS